MSDTCQRPHRPQAFRGFQAQVPRCGDDAVRGALRRELAGRDEGGRLGILSIILQLFHGAAERSPSGPSLVFSAGDLPGLANDAACSIGRLFLHPGIGGEFLCRVASDMAQEERHADILANLAVFRQTGGWPGATAGWAARRRSPRQSGQARKEDNRMTGSGALTACYHAICLSGVSKARFKAQSRRSGVALRISRCAISGHSSILQRRSALSPFCTTLRCIRTEGMWGNPDVR